MVAWSSSIATCPSTADAAGHGDIGTISVVTSLRARACHTGPKAMLSVWSLAIHCPAGDCIAICREVECDLMMFPKEHGKVNVPSLVERVSRYAVVMRNEDRAPNRSWNP